jgi:GT2 family glycosyltransferase
MSRTSLRLQTVLFRTDEAAAHRHLLAAQRAAEYVQARVENLEISLAFACADDVSHAAARAVAEESQAQLQIVALPHNLGHGQGHNAMWGSLGAVDFLVMQNPDGQLAHDALWELLGPLRAEHRLGLTEARQVPFDHPKAYSDAGQVVWASGACFMVRGDAWGEVGGFDELFFLHGDDVDLSVRLRLAGYGIRYVPSARFFHAKSVDTVTGRIATSSGESHYGRLGALLLARRYNPGALTAMVAELRSSGDPENEFVLEAFKRTVDPRDVTGTQAADKAVLPIYSWTFGRHRY